MNAVLVLALTCTAIAGSYTRSGENSEATITVACVDDATVRVEGIALWGLDRDAPHTGEIDFTAPLNGNTVQWRDPDDDSDHAYSVTLTFEDDALNVREENASSYLGMNVTFAGNYTKDP
jgi:hypothetical protein